MLPLWALWRKIDYDAKGHTASASGSTGCVFLHRVLKTMSLIAIDGMGGDKAPDVIIHGLAIFHERCPASSFLIYGEEGVLRPILAQYPSVQKCSQLIHTPEFITGEMKSLHALRKLNRSSMRLALGAVASGEADGVVSAGNTGAYMALCTSLLQPLEGIHRPAIVSFLPTQRGESVMLDLGGNIRASAKNLVDYGIMADLFVRHVLGISSPSVGLLNVGRERSKGTEILQEAYAGLENAPLNFYGFIEGDDIGLGTVDIIVTDGFTGNVALKMGEGILRLSAFALKRTLQGNLRGRLAAWLARPLLKDMQKHFDPRAYNGALWLGVKEIAVKSHGNTDAWGFAHAVEIAYDMIQAKIHKILAQAFPAVKGEIEVMCPEEAIP